MLLKNLKLFMKYNTFIFVLMIITQIFSTIVILFCYGVYLNNQYQINEEAGCEKQFYVDFYEDPFYKNDGKDRRREPECFSVNMKDLKDNFAKIVKPIENKIEWVNIYSVGDCNAKTGHDNYDQLNQVSVFTVFNYNDGSFDYLRCLGSDAEKHIQGEWFNNKDIYKGSNACFVDQRVYESVNSDTIKIADKEYRIIGYLEESNDNVNSMPIIIPLYSLSDEMYPLSFGITLTQPILKSEYDELVINCKKYLGKEIKILDFYVVDVDEEAVMKTMMTSSILLGIISAVTIAMIYRFLLASRRKMTVIYRICGSRYLKTVSIYLKEMIFNLTACMGLGCLLFATVIEPVLERKYKWFEFIYSNGRCYKLILVYYIIIVVVSSIFLMNSMRKTPIQLLKGNNN